MECFTDIFAHTHSPKEWTIKRLGFICFSPFQTITDCENYSKRKYLLLPGKPVFFQSQLTIGLLRLLLKNSKNLTYSLEGRTYNKESCKSISKAFVNIYFFTKTKSCHNVKLTYLSRYTGDIWNNSLKLFQKLNIQFINAILLTQRDLYQHMLWHLHWQSADTVADCWENRKRQRNNLLVKLVNCRMQNRIGTRPKWLSSTEVNPSNVFLKISTYFSLLADVC